MRLLIRLAVSLAATVALPLAVPAPSSATCESCVPVVASGRVTRDGQPVPAALVELRALPPAAELAERPRGALVATPVVASTVTDVAGRYALRLDPVSVGRFRSEARTFDLQLVTEYDGQAVSLPFSATVAGKGPAPRWISTHSDGGPGRFDLELDAGFRVSTPSGTTRRISRKLADGADLCAHVELGDWFYDVREKFLVVHNWPGARATVEEAIQGASEHELGIAVKYPSKAWQPSYTLSLSEGESTGSGARVTGIVDKAVYNSVNYRELIYKSWNSHEECFRERRPMSFYDLLSEPHTDITHLNFRKGCTIRRRGELWKDSEKNQTFKSGVDLGVVHLSAQSGYSQGTRVGFTITRPTRICTNDEQGWLEATRFDLRSARRTPPGVV